MGTIYKRLSEARNALGLKQRELASLSGMSLRAYARYESGEGERDVPSSVLDVYAQNGINTNWLLTGKGPMHLSHEEPSPESKIEPKDKDADELLSVFMSMDEEGRKEMLRLAKKEQLFAELMKERAG